MSAVWHAPALLHKLTGLRFGLPVHVYGRLGSTNDEARRLAQAGAPEGLLVIAEEQTAGRGRAGRRWLTPPGPALAFSLVLRPPAPAAEASRLSMLAGLALCEAIERVAGVPVQLKWPNDILIHGQKAGGILLETALDAGTQQLDYAVLGIGVNVAEAPPPEAVDFPATALDAEAGRPVDRLDLLRAILERLEAHYPRLEAGSGLLHTAWAARLAWLGESVVARTPDGETVGRAVGADEDGALLVVLDSGVRVRVTAGDVRLRLAPVR